MTGPRPRPSRVRRSPAIASIALVLFAVACGSPAPVLAPRAPRDLIVLTTDPEDGTLGEVSVTTPQGSVALTRANESVQVHLGSAPGTPAILSAADLHRLFGDALAVLPPPARRFVLYFELGSDILTSESRALVPAILATVQSRVRPDVSIVGHTDATGTADANVALGQRRADLVRDLLTAAGLDGGLVEVASHGETNPLVPTPDNTAEPRNRRVDVTVR